ncbi:MAG: hypothetical protein M1820_009323 [Bogoriella megaspora]|nr:MAG: hypothetical protein M1820_009323 [Bogoriella megaspora]
MSRRPDGLDLVSPRAQRRSSTSSDRPSLSGASITMPSRVHPLPAYVAASAASQMVTDHQIGEDDEEDESLGTAVDDGALFSEGALASLNAFLDHLLYSFLANAKSTSLAALRPAIAEVLKTRLARDAIASADEDLEDLLSGTEDEEELATMQQPGDTSGKWDLETVWRRTRLRVMVYIRLGEMEDEDEERYLEEDEYFSSDNRRFSRSNGLVSWAAAIFLTSVIEFMAEQTIVCAGKAAYNRALKRRTADARNSVGSEPGQARTIVEEGDMEKVALDSTLSRLWRTWRRRLKSPSSSASTPAPSRLGNRPGSLTSPRRTHSVDGYTDGGFSETDDFRTPSSTREAEATKSPKIRTGDLEPENIPLPMGDRDIDEIEVPGLAKTFEEESEEESEDDTPLRRASFVTLMRSKDDSVAVQDNEVDERPILKRARSRSLPMPGAFGSDSREQSIPTPRVRETVQEEKADPKTTVDKAKGSDRKSFVAAGASMVAAAYDMVMGTRKQDEPSSPISPVTDTDESLLREAHSRDIDHALDSQVMDSRRVSVIRPNTSPELVQHDRHGSGSSYSTDQSFSLGQKSQDISREPSREPVRDVSPLPKESVDVSQQTAPPMPDRNEARRIPAPQHEDEDEDEDEDARKFERIAKATAPAAAVATVGAAGAAAVAARKPPAARPTAKATAQPWDEPSAEQFLAAQALQGPADRNDSISKTRRTADVAVSQPVVNRNSPTAAPTREKVIRKLVESSPTQGSLQAPPSQMSRGPSTDSIASSSSAKPQPLAVKTSQKPQPKIAPPIAPAPEGSMPRRGTRGSKSSIDSLGDQHAQVTPISAPSGRQRDFDALVRGEETMKYTLTPQGMRDFEAGSPRSPGQDLDRPRGSKLTKLSPEVSRPVESTSSAQQTPDRNYPARSSSVTGRSSSSQAAGSPHPTSRTQSTKSIIRPSPKNFTANRKGLVAREPQVQTTSTKDLADFFQTTAPEKESGPVPLLLTRSQSNSADVARKATGSSYGQSSKNDRRNSLGKSTNRSSLSAASKSDTPPMPATAPKKMGLQARDAVSSSSPSNDLIDFLRQGPPPGMNGIASTTNQPRHTAPSTTTRDTSTIGSLSARTSANSRTGLLAQTNSPSSSSVSQPAYSSSKQALSPPGGGSSLGAGAPDLGKKRYRNKDPYAIDLDDDDEDLLTALPNQGGRPKRQEESLIDFLNSVEPPTFNEPKPLSASAAARSMSNVNGTKQQANTSRKAETSSPSNQGSSFKTRPPPIDPSPSHPSTSGFRQNGAPPSRSGILSTTTNRAPNGGTTTTTSVGGAPISPLAMNAPTPPHTRPASVSNNSSSQLPSSSSSPPPAVPSATNGFSNTNTTSTISASNKPRPKIEARSPGVATKSAGSAARLDAFHTDDLADFLRTSGPPDGGAPAPVVGRGRVGNGEQGEERRRDGGKDGGGRGKRGRFPWSRRTYLDMP